MSDTGSQIGATHVRSSASLWQLVVTAKAFRGGSRAPDLVHAAKAERYECAAVGRKGGEGEDPVRRFARVAIFEWTEETINATLAAGESTCHSDTQELPVDCVVTRN